MSFEKVMSSMLDSMQRDKSFNNLTPTLERLLIHWQDPLRLIIMGEFNAGKSTLINTLLRDEVIASGIVPTTAIGTYIRYSEEKYIEVVYQNGLVERKSIEEMEKLTSERNIEGKQQREIMHHINLYFPNPILKNIVLIDTPGLDALHVQHHLQAFDAYGEADDSMWIFKFGSVGKNSEVSVLKKLEDQGLRPIGVVNMIDQSEVDDIQPYINYEFEKLNERVRKLIGVSAIEAKEAYETNDQELLEISGFPQFITIIDEIKNDKDLRKKKRFDQSFLNFWVQLNDTFYELLNSDRYMNSMQKIKSNLLDLKKENEIIFKRFSEEKSKMIRNNQQILYNISNTVHLNDWAISNDFKDLIIAIPELKEWKEFKELHSDLLKDYDYLKRDVSEFKNKITEELGDRIGYLKVLSTKKNILGKFRTQQINLLNKEREINKQIKIINGIYGHLVKEKNFVQEKLTNYYKALFEKNESTVMMIIDSERNKLIKVNLLSKRLLMNQIRQWEFLSNLREQMISVSQFVQQASTKGVLLKELPHMKVEAWVENEINSLNEALKKLPSNTSLNYHFKVNLKLPIKLNSVNEVPSYFLRNIRPLVGAFAVALVTLAFILYQSSN
nr:dynamin family protein [Lysinibacillus timonensis]